MSEGKFVVYRIPFQKDKKVGYIDLYSVGSKYYHGNLAYTKEAGEKKAVVYRCGSNVTTDLIGFNVNKFSWRELLESFSDLPSRTKSENIGYIRGQASSIEDLFKRTESIFNKKEKEELGEFGELEFIMLTNHLHPK